MIHAGFWIFWVNLLALVIRPHSLVTLEEQQTGEFEDYTLTIVKNISLKSYEKFLPDNENDFNLEESSNIDESFIHKLIHLYQFNPDAVLSIDIIKNIATKLLTIYEGTATEGSLFGINEDSPMIALTIPEEAKFTFVGDLHGRFSTLLGILETFGPPASDHIYLFNGDFVDRGPASTRVIVLLICLKLLYPLHVYLNRGNHEANSINAKYGFQAEFFRLYPNEHDTYNLLQKLFNLLPLCFVLQNSVFISHGGVPYENDNVAIDFNRIRSINRNVDIGYFSKTQDYGIWAGITWADPQEKNGIGPSKRKIGWTFGPDICDAFLKHNELKFCMRSHQVHPEGYKVFFKGKLISVFSCDSYM